MKFIGLFLVLSLGISLAGSARDPWTPANLLQPAEFASEIQQGKKMQGEKMEILHVGFGVLFRSKHIPGSVYAGPGSKPEGIQKMLDAVKGLDHGARIVLYCGCCPLNKCPNVRPAFSALQKEGFRNIRVLDLPENLAVDWIAKRYPVVEATKD